MFIAVIVIWSLTQGLLENCIYNTVWLLSTNYCLTVIRDVFLVHKISNRRRQISTVSVLTTISHFPYIKSEIYKRPALHLKYLFFPSWWSLWQWFHTPIRIYIPTTVRVNVDHKQFIKLRTIYVSIQVERCKKRIIIIRNGIYFTSVATSWWG